MSVVTVGSSQVFITNVTLTCALQVKVHAFPKTSVFIFAVWTIYFSSEDRYVWRLFVFNTEYNPSPFFETHIPRKLEGIKDQVWLQTLGAFSRVLISRRCVVFLCEITYFSGTCSSGITYHLYVLPMWNNVPFAWISAEHVAAIKRNWRKLIAINGNSLKLANLNGNYRTLTGSNGL